MSLDDGSRALGKVEGRLEHLETQVQELNRKIDDLTALANKSKGGLWAGMTIVGTFGGFLGYAIKDWFKT